jgi:hypothetical protein
LNYWIIKLLGYYSTASDLLTNGIRWEKPRRLYFRLSEKTRSCQKPSWFDKHHAKKNQEGFISDFQKKIRTCQKPSWFDKHHAKKNQEGFISDFQKKLEPSKKTFLV